MIPLRSAVTMPGRGRGKGLPSLSAPPCWPRPVVRLVPSDVQEAMVREAKASRTAQYMAFFRALEAARPADRRLCHDPLARAFLSGGLRLATELARAAPVGALLRCRKR